MKQHDILLNVAGNLEWVTEIYEQDVNDAITAAIHMVGPAEYVGHKSFAVVDGAWKEVA